MRGVRVSHLTDKLAVSLYTSGYGVRATADRLGVSITPVLRALRDAGISLRSKTEAARDYRVDESAFDILTPDARYWIGFLMADGCVTGSETQSPVISLALAQEDIEHVRQFAAFLSSNAPVKTVQRKGGFLRGGHAQAKFTVSSVRLAAKLAAHGVIRRKTGLEVASKELASCPHFWRGVVDGDGNVSWVKPRRQTGFVNGKPAIRLSTTSERLICQFAEFIRSVFPSCMARPYHRLLEPSQIAFYSMEVRSRAAVAVMEALYECGGPSLARKKLIVSDCLSRYASRIDGRTARHVLRSSSR